MKKLTATGFAHLVVIIGIIVILGIAYAGVTVIGASHANTADSTGGAKHGTPPPPRHGPKPPPPTHGPTPPPPTHGPTPPPPTH